MDPWQSYAAKAAAAPPAITKVGSRAHSGGSIDQSEDSCGALVSSTVKASWRNAKEKIKRITRRVDVTRFSTAKTTPSFVLTPMAVEPSCPHQCARVSLKQEADGSKVRFLDHYMTQIYSAQHLVNATLNASWKMTWQCSLSPATFSPWHRLRARSYLDGFDRVLHLEKPAFRAERIHPSIILTPCQKHSYSSRMSKT